MHLYRDPGEKNTQPSMTVPDQAMSVRELLQRYARGLPLGGMKTPVFDEDDEMPDIAHLDLAERQEIKEQYEAELTEITEKHKKRSQKVVSKPDVVLPDAAPPVLEP
nr:MAG: hypothetical protein [Microvirus sp.]